MKVIKVLSAFFAKINLYQSQNRILFLFFVLCEVHGGNISFSRDHLIVLTHHFVALGDSSFTYDDDEIHPILSTVATRFSKLSSPPVGAEDAEYSLPRAVAKYNVRETNVAPLEIIVMFKEDGRAASQDKLQISFRIALTLADEANEIYNGTVKYLIGYLDELNSLSINESTCKFQQYREHLNKRSNGEKTYQLGLHIYFLIFGRKKDTLCDPSLLPLLSGLDMVVFNVIPDQQIYDGGVPYAFSIFTGMLQICKQKMKEMNISTEVVLSTGWSDTDFEGKHNVGALVEFWTKINRWALRTNTKVIMTEAFNIPNRPGNWKNFGWWKLDTKQPYVSTTEYKFVEKLEVLQAERSPPFDVRNGLNPDINSTSVSHSATYTTVLLPLIIFALVLIFIILVVILAKKKHENTKRYLLLSKKDVAEFFDGGPSIPGKIEAQSEDNRINLVRINSAPYNRKMEIDKDNFCVKDSIIGCGNYGVVCNGIILKDGCELDVAVKTVKDCTLHASLKSIMGEIKLLSYLGNHPNIISLIGAHTSEIDMGKILMFLEFCKRGSLNKFLLELKPQRGDTLTEIIACRSGTRLDSHMFYRWAREIVCGMEYLASKHVVHADLATRNVLLGDNLTAKISDFGLSRRMYNYTSYVKTGKEPLPWRWMPPESLHRNQFNEKTDVWAYGITLWEIYSFGGVPYPGLEWSQNFHLELKQGLRLQEPEYIADDMYVMMKKCWELEPSMRPSFTEIRESLPAKYDEVV